MVCIFCLNETNDNVPLHGDLELAKHARYVVTKHFWFNVNDIDSAEKYACSYCWAEVKSFHNFYGMVEANYPNILNVIDATQYAVNETKSLANETAVIKVENHGSDADYKTEPIQFLPNLVEPKEENNEATTSNDNFNSKLPTYRQNEFEEKRKSQTQNAQPTPGSRIFSCPVCQKQYSKSGLQRHMPLHDPEESFTLECDLCGKKFSRKTTIALHLYLHQKYKRTKEKTHARIPCPMCEKFISRCNLSTHILRMHKNIRNTKYMCEFCGKGFEAPSMLAQHAVVHTSQELTKVQCGICGKWLKTEYSLKKHKKIHKQTAQKCDHCDTIAYSAHEMKVHMSQFHSQHKHQCSICQKSFIRPIRLREHIAAVHRDERTLECLYCSKAFKMHSTRFRHMKDVHPMEYNLNRELRKSNQQTFLKSHVSRVHMDKKYHCSICPRSFSRPIILREHEATHTGSMLYDCPYCSLKFRNNSNMATQIRGQHTSEWIRDREMKEIYGRC